MKARHLLATLIYVQNFPEAMEVNPLIPLLWWWTEGKTWPTDNVFFTLPQLKIRRPTSTAPVTGWPGRKPIPTYCVISLSEGIVEVDGNDYYGSARFRGH